MRPSLLLPVALLGAIASPVRAAQGQAPGASPAAACGADPAYHLLDFWVGSWEVYAAGALDGHDRVSVILAGCALTEEWTARDGSRGLSLFYLEPASHQWRQVWVTEQANRPGGLKEKAMVEQLPGGAVRFQGTIAGGGNGHYLDRTTLTPLPSGEVHQVIEVSSDTGSSWRAVYDARYRRSH